MRRLRIALAQVNMTVGDLAGNVAIVREFAARARDAGADVVAFPELAITGYPPEDLLLRRQFIRDNIRALHDAAAACAGITAVIGFVDAGADIHNAAAIVHDGAVVDVYHKQYLPNYGVFDENRYFQEGARTPLYEIAGVKVGVNICEDIWYPNGPALAQVRGGAEVIININASPYHRGKLQFRETMLRTRATDNAVIVCYVNLVGGQDELVFDGGSFVVNERGELLGRAPQFDEDLLVVDLPVEGVFSYRLHDPRRRKERLEFELQGGLPQVLVSEAPAMDGRGPLPAAVSEPLEEAEEVYRALVVGTRDYVRKVGFESVLVGLSGGIDSSLVAAVAVDALGADHVVGVSMPSRFSSEGSRADAELLAQRLGIRVDRISIEPPFQAYLDTMAQVFAGTPFGLTEENLQARARGNILMALSNKFGWLVLTTGNKSEYATGYCTLYGDMAGGYAVLKDVPKTLVYELARYRNRKGEVIPESILGKPPSAELRPDQLDVDSLPPYEALDPILEAYVEEDRSLEEMVAMGFDEETVRRVMRLVDLSEYKRRQSPPGVKITPRAFGRDRRLPLANHYRGY